ncbi:putative bifunctional diguanylate cyclase/phosphodiesterase [Paenibacillus woosongensis]|nr:EAL domain-containing protein [Paenibacillus woosongensis]
MLIWLCIKPRRPAAAVSCLFQGARIPSSHRLEIENDLRKALNRGQLIVYYQPQYELKKDKIFGVEALLRWKSPLFGLVSPEVFIPIAESTGLIIAIGEWVLREACQLSSSYKRHEGDSLRVSVNISARQLSHADFIDMVRQVLDETGCDPHDLCLEITESMMLTDINYSMKIVRELIELGVVVSIDDFGTGYSSLSLMKSFPIGELKIDKSFIKDMTESEENKAIVHAIIKISQILSLKVVAEGVETLEQMNILRELGVDYIQGYYISRTVPVEELILFLKGFNRED